MLTWLPMLASIPSAHAADDPGLWWSQTGVVAFQPTGLLSDSRLEYRVPVLRMGGAVFNDTFVGAGARLTASPAHAEVAARLNTQLIDVLPISFEAAYATFWPSPFGLLDWPDGPVDDTSSPLRKPRYQAGESFLGYTASVTVAPTLQMKVGPIVGFSGWSLSYKRLITSEPLEQPWYFEPYRGMVLDRDDQVVDHTSAILWQPKDGEDQALIRLGPVLRGQWADTTGDRTLTLGGLGQWKPNPKTSVPTLFAIVSGYLQDTDYLGPVPFMAFGVTWATE